MVAVPAAIPAITPEEALIVAVPGAEDVHVPPVTVEVNVELPPLQIAWVPESVPDAGAAVIVTFCVVVPPLPLIVKVAVLVPADE